MEGIRTQRIMQNFIYPYIVYEHQVGWKWRVNQMTGKKVYRIITIILVIIVIIVIIQPVISHAINLNVPREIYEKQVNSVIGKLEWSQNDDYILSTNSVSNNIFHSGSYSPYISLPDHQENIGVGGYSQAIWNENTIIAISQNGNLTWWNTSDYKLQGCEQTNKMSTYISINDNFIAIGGTGIFIYYFPNMTFIGHVSGMKALFSPDGNSIAVLSSQNTSIFSFPDMTLKFFIPNNNTQDIIWSSKGDLISTISGKFINVWDVATQQRKITINSNSGNITAIDWSTTNNELIAIGTIMRNVEIWNITTNEMSESLSFNPPPANTIFDYGIDSVQWSHNGDYLIASSFTDVKLWSFNQTPIIYSKMNIALFGISFGMLISIIFINKYNIKKNQVAE